VTTLAAKSHVSSNLVFANRHKIPFDWPDNTLSTTLESTPMAEFPNIPAEMPKCFYHVMSQTLMLLMMTLMNYLHIPTKLTGPNLPMRLLRMLIWML
jgi:hypothetical protein